MNEPQSGPAVPSRAAGISRAAAGWLERRDRDDWSKSDQRAFEAWLAESPAHRLAYWRLNGAWAHTERLAALRPQRRGRSGLTADTRRRLLHIAAAVVLIACVGFVAMTSRPTVPREQVYATGLGVRETITLPDGSQIDLNTDTMVHVAARGDVRRVVLDRGEALFRIKHDPAHPFVVVAGDHRITDIGTTFLVHRTARHLEVALIEGRARVDTVTANGVGQTKMLTPGDVALASAKALNVEKKSKQALVDELGWRHGVLIFHRTPLAEAVAEFNRYNSHKLRVADAATGDLPIGGTFQSNNPQLFARVAADILNLNLKTHGRETVFAP